MGDQKPASFTIDLDEQGDVTRKRKIPKRFQERRETHITKEQIEKKLQQASARKKDQEKERQQRIQEREEECRKLHLGVETLLEQDAKRSGKAGTENLPRMSKREAIKAIRTVSKGFDSMSSKIVSDFKEVK